MAEDACFDFGKSTVGNLHQLSKTQGSNWEGKGRLSNSLAKQTRADGGLKAPRGW